MTKRDEDVRARVTFAVCAMLQRLDAPARSSSNSSDSSSSSSSSSKTHSVSSALPLFLEFLCGVLSKDTKLGFANALSAIECLVELPKHVFPGTSTLRAVLQSGCMIALSTRLSVKETLIAADSALKTISTCFKACAKHIARVKSSGSSGADDGVLGYMEITVEPVLEVIYRRDKCYSALDCLLSLCSCGAQAVAMLSPTPFSSSAGSSSSSGAQAQARLRARLKALQSFACSTFEVKDCIKKILNCMEGVY
jgi:hypothetical protein